MLPMKPLQSFWFSNLLVGSLILLALSIGWTDSAIAEDISDSDAASTPQSAAIQRGAAIYQSLCTECHGDAGQGVEGMYDDPLLGDATVGELADLISETMPEGDPDACVAEDAVAVANFIHQAFYSEAARTRNRPPRVDLSR